MHSPLKTSNSIKYEFTPEEYWSYPWRIPWKLKPHPLRIQHFFTLPLKKCNSPIIGGGSWITGSRLFIILCFFLQIIHYSFQFFQWYSLFIFLVFVSIFLSQIFYMQFYTLFIKSLHLSIHSTSFNLIFSKYHSIFSINEIMLSFIFFYFIILPHTMNYKQNKNDNK